MEYDSRGPILNVLLLIRGKSSHMGAPEELLRFPDGRLALEHALETLHSAVPSASTIYISFHDKTQFNDVESLLKDVVARARTAEDAKQVEHDHHHHTFPELTPIFDEQEEDIGPAAGLLAAHSLHPDAKWLVLSCEYPLLPPPALQQLILEYQSSVTCFVNETGLAQPLVAIWDSEALEKLRESVKSGTTELNGIVEDMNGILIKPLREQWITRADTKEEWDKAMASRGG